MNSATASPLTCPSINAQTSSPRRQILQRIQLIRSYWNWKCALLSATVRSTVYLIAMARSHNSGKLGIILVEIAYVALTAGIYAGLQQQALRLRSHLWGNLAVVIGVPGLSQALDWLAHILTREPIPHRALLTVCIFTLLSALFHLHIMRRGAFLTGHGERSLLQDFRRIPRLTLGFILWPYQIITRRTRNLGAEAAA